MFFAGKALLLRGGNQFSVSEEGGCGIVVEGGNSQNIHQNCRLKLSGFGMPERVFQYESAFFLLFPSGSLKVTSMYSRNNPIPNK
jgi:hypothetical protein